MEISEIFVAVKLKWILDCRQTLLCKREDGGDTWYNQIKFSSQFFEVFSIITEHKNAFE